MKTAAISSPLIASPSLEGSIMGMDAAGMQQATYFMRDKIYSNKIGAVVREYICNAVDEHKKHSITRPVETGMRRDGSEISFFVRDFAKGLSGDLVRNVFGMYFKSTKSGSDDSIGGFGVGSKAGHCYNDTFFVTTFFEGVKRVYTCMLGGGDTGVPVGHIYEIGTPEPTTESGLEISVPINPLDRNRFEEELIKMIGLSPFDIIDTNENGVVFKPYPTIFQKQVGKFNLRLIKNERSGNQNFATLQMGGVSYGSLRLDFPHSCRIRAGHTLVVDVPVGTMTIPISREAFEKTPANTKVEELIVATLKEQAESEMSKFGGKTFASLSEDFLKSGQNDLELTADIFSTRTSSFYRNEWRILSQIGKHMPAPYGVAQGVAAEKKDKKYVLVIIPSNVAERYWRTKLTDFCKAETKNYYTIAERVHDECSGYGLPLADCFDVVKVKSLPFPKQKRDTKRYTIYANGCSIGSKTPMELHTYFGQMHGLKAVATTPKEAKTQIEDVIKTIKNRRGLRAVVIANKNKQSANRDHIGYFSSSEKFVEQMRELGWLEYGTQKYIEIVTALEEAERLETEKRNAVSNATKRWLKFSDKTGRLIKKPSNALRVVKLWQGLHKENSIRSKIFKSIENGGYGASVTYTREDFRKIMKLK